MIEMELNWINMLKRRILEQGTQEIHHTGDVYSHPANLYGAYLRPAPQWRGPAVKKFMKHPPPPGYHIPDRIYNIVCDFPTPWDSDETDTEDEDTEDEDGDEYKDESDSEDEVMKKKNELMKKKKKKKKEEYLYDSDSEGESEDEEELLDELQAYDEFVNVIRILDIDNRLFPFLRYVLSNKNAASIRAKGAEVLTTMVQNNPASQQLVIRERGLHRLLRNLTTDPDATSRTKALGAISSLIRNNEPGITAFRLANGYATLRDALSSESVGFQREVLKLIQYLLHENSSDCNIVTELGIPRIMMRLASNDDLEIRETALRGLLILARDEGGNSGQLVKNDGKLKRVLRKRIKGISAMAPEDLGAAREERQLVDSLWNACYNEPSSLGKKGLLVLPGEDAPAPDVASKLFGPSLGACSTAQAVDRNSVSEKDCNIVTELGLPRIIIHLASSDDPEVREAALRGLLILARDEGGNSGQLVKNDDKLKRVLRKLIKGISAMAPEDIGATREERRLVDSLWNACYNEPSSLGKKGLLVLPFEVLFKPSLRACSAAQAVDRNSVRENKEAPLILLPSAATPTVQVESSSKRRKRRKLH